MREGRAERIRYTKARQQREAQRLANERSNNKRNSFLFFIDENVLRDIYSETEHHYEGGNDPKPKTPKKK